jgi:hypothetical protein
MVEGGAADPRCINCRGETRCIRCGIVKKNDEFCHSDAICSHCQPRQHSKYALDEAAAVHSFPTSSSDIDLAEYLSGQQSAIAEQLDAAISKHR